MSSLRLFEIVYVLIGKKRVSAAELAEKFEVSVRTIYRDIDDLSSAGIPVYTTRGRGGGISLLDGFVLDKALLTIDEQREILTALKSSFASRDGGERLSDKLSAIFRSESVDWMEVDLTRWGSKKNEQKNFDLIKDAILSKSILTFDYLGIYGEKENRRVKPVKMIFKAYSWYVQAFCIDRDSFRTFKINRIDNPRVLEEHFYEKLLAPPIERGVVEQEQGEKVNIKIRVEKPYWYRIYEDFDSENIVVDEKTGDLILSVDMIDGEWSYEYFLSYGKYLEVLSPKRVRETIRKLACETAKKHE